MPKAQFVASLESLIFQMLHLLRNLALQLKWNYLLLELSDRSDKQIQIIFMKLKLALECAKQESIFQSMASALFVRLVRSYLKLQMNQLIANNAQGMLIALEEI